MLASFPKLARLFFLCKYPLFPCFSLVLFLLLLGVGFDLNLVPFWGYLSWVSRAFVCVSQEFLSHPGQGQTCFLLTLWLNCSKFDKQISMVPFLPIAMLVFVLYLKRLFKLTKGFCLPQEVYGRRLIFSSRGVFTCFMCALFSPLMGRFFNLSLSSMFIFKESWWIQLRG